MPAYRCPNCGVELEYIDFSVCGGHEWGCYSLPDIQHVHRDQEAIYHGDHDYQDSESGDDFSYQCPECNEEISLTTLIEQARNYVSDEDGGDDEEEESVPDEPGCDSNAIGIEQKFVSHILTPKNDYRECPKCHHSIILSENEIMSESLKECPNCEAKLNLSNNSDDDGQQD